MHALIGSDPQLLRRLSRQRQNSGEPTAVGGTIRPAQCQAESTAGADHDDHLRLAARASAPGSDGGRFCSDGGPYMFLPIRYSRMAASNDDGTAALAAPHVGGVAAIVSFFSFFTAWHCFCFSRKPATLFG